MVLYKTESTYVMNEPLGKGINKESTYHYRCFL